MSAEEFARVNAALKAGASPEIVAEKTGISLEQIKRVQRGAAPSPTRASGGALAGAVHKADGGLAKALGAAGFGSGSAAPSGEPSAGTATPGADPLPQITPDELLAMLGAINGMVCKAAATIWQVELTKEQLANLYVYTREEKEILKPLAPFAAEYAPTLMAQFKPVCAGLFVATALVLSGTRVWEIRQRKPVKLTRAAKAAPKAAEVVENPIP